MRILIEKADWIVTVDAGRRLLQGGSILVENDRIVFVGPASELASIDADRRIDGRGLLIAPGFVDTHVHNTQQLGRGLADECDIPKQLLERLYGYESVLTSHEAYLAAKLCQMELIKAGTTCFPRSQQLLPRRDGARRFRDRYAWRPSPGPRSTFTARQSAICRQERCFVRRSRRPCGRRRAPSLRIETPAVAGWTHGSH